jgi:hypothetical protein
MYNGAFEPNYESPSTETTTYKSTEGDERPLPKWPDEVDGFAWVGGKGGEEVLRVRVQYEDHDVIIENPVAIDPLRHTGNQRFSAEPTVVVDDEARPCSTTSSATTRE